MRRSIGFLSALTLVIAACGGGGETSEPSSASTTVDAAVADTQPDEDQPGSITTEAVKEAPSAAGGEEGTGTATIGDMTWEFELTGEDGREVCSSDLNGMFIAIFIGADETGKQTVFSVNVPRSGGSAIVQAGYATIDAELWIADPAVYDKNSGIEGIPEGVGVMAQVDGDTVSGSGTFYEDRHLTEVRTSGGSYDVGVLEGTFSATCPAG